MNRPTTYKKHMKRVSDLFWIPRDSSAFGSHWQFDENYSVVHHENFPSERSDEVLKSTFSSGDRNTFPIPMLETSGTENDWSNDADERGTQTRTRTRIFLPFPDGFCADLQSSESHYQVVGPIGIW
jgi:hypothetical protein